MAEFVLWLSSHILVLKTPSTALVIRNNVLYPYMTGRNYTT